MTDAQEILNFLKDRRTIRSFEDREIPDESIKMILEAGRWTPSAANRQSWEFIAIKNKDLLKKLWESKAIFSPSFQSAPLAIAIVGKIKENKNWYDIDVALASMQIMLMAWALDIGTCWIGSMSREKSKEILELGENDFLLTILPMGYIKGNIPNPPPRKDLSQISRIID